MPWVTRGLRHGVVTTGWPARDDSYAAQLRSGMRVVGRPQAADDDEAAELRALCPASAITVEESSAREIRLDRGRCILCGRCAAQRPDLFDWTTGPDVATVLRSTLVVPRDSDEDDSRLEAVRGELARRTAALRRSVHIRHVDAGSDGAEEWEILALLNPVYDVNRLGIYFTASPRHADILLVSGVGATGMAAPLARTLEAMPAPTVVVAAGSDAISGGLVHPTYASSGGVGEQLPVDVWVPGAPPSPFAILRGLLTAIGRLR